MLILFLLYESIASLYATLTANWQGAAVPEEFLILTAGLGWTPGVKESF